MTLYPDNCQRVAATLPILTFHDLASDDDVLAYPPAQFAALVAQICEAGWQSASLPDALARLDSAVPRVVLTFDDGYRSIYETAYPMLCEAGLTATLFVTTGTSSDGGLSPMYGRERLTWSQIREMHAGGMIIGAHTCTHPDLTRLADAAIRAEMGRSQAVLQDALGVDVSAFAYPFGACDARVSALAQEFFECAVSTDLRLAKVGSDCFRLPRVEMVYFRHPRTRHLITSKALSAYLWLRRIPRLVRQRIVRQIAGVH